MSALYGLLIVSSLIATFVPAVLPDLAWHPANVSWVADAGMEVYGVIGWVSGFNGTVIVALYVDRSIGGADVRPETRSQARHRLFVALIALAAAVLQSYCLALMLYAHIAMDAHVADLLAAAPVTLLVVALCLSMGSRARPRLTAEIESLQAYIASNDTAAEALAKSDPEKGSGLSVVWGLATPLALALTIAAAGAPPSLDWSTTVFVITVALAWLVIACTARVLVLRAPELSVVTRAVVVIYSICFGLVVEEAFRLLGRNLLQSFLMSTILVGVPIVMQVFVRRATPATAFSRVTFTITKQLIEKAVDKHKIRLNELIAEQRQATRLRSSEPAEPTRLIDLATGIRRLPPTS